MKIQFVKMQGCGNDYIYFDCLNIDEKEQDYIASKAAALSDRHFGVGGDGVILICKSETANAKMRMFNADGSEGRMCGNASRCIAKFLYDRGYAKDKNLTLETLGGIKKISLSVKDGVCAGATVNMGKAELKPQNIPINIELLQKEYKQAKEIVDMPLSVCGVEYKITTVSMGNPHCVIFTDKILNDFNLEKLGPAFENNPLFPQRVNTEFAKVTGENELYVRVWERGSGETLACGTGSCAVAVAAVKNGLCGVEKPVNIKLKGGELKIEIKKDGVYMTGPAEYVFEGAVEI